MTGREDDDCTALWPSQIFGLLNSVLTRVKGQLHGPAENMTSPSTVFIVFVLDLTLLITGPKRQIGFPQIDGGAQIAVIRGCVTIMSRQY